MPGEEGGGVVSLKQVFQDKHHITNMNSPGHGHRGAAQTQTISRGRPSRELYRQAIPKMRRDVGAESDTQDFPRRRRRMGREGGKGGGEGITLTG